MTLFFSIRFRCFACELAKQPTEIAGIWNPNQTTDFPNGFIAGGEQPFCLVDAEAVQILDGSHSDLAAEFPREVVQTPAV